MNQTIPTMMRVPTTAPPIARPRTVPETPEVGGAPEVFVAPAPVDVDVDVVEEDTELSAPDVACEPGVDVVDAPGSKLALGSTGPAFSDEDGVGLGVVVGEGAAVFPPMIAKGGEVKVLMPSSKKMKS